MSAGDKVVERIFLPIAECIVMKFFVVIARLDRAIQRKNVDYPVKSDADLREESLRPDNDSRWNRINYEY